MRYTITNKAKSMPRRILSPITGDKIGIGGSINMPATTSEPAYVVREANNAEYIAIVKKGGLIGLVEVAQNDVEAEDTKGKK